MKCRITIGKLVELKKKLNQSIIDDNRYKIEINKKQNLMFGKHDIIKISPM